MPDRKEKDMENKYFEMETLSEDELALITGGTDIRPQLMQMQCTCGTINLVDITKNSYTCKKCHKINRIDG